MLLHISLAPSNALFQMQMGVAIVTVGLNVICLLNGEEEHLKSRTLKWMQWEEEEMAEGRKRCSCLRSGVYIKHRRPATMSLSLSLSHTGTHPGCSCCSSDRHLTHMQYRLARKNFGYICHIISSGNLCSLVTNPCFSFLFQCGESERESLPSYTCSTDYFLSWFYLVIDPHLCAFTSVPKRCKGVGIHRPVERL